MIVRNENGKNYELLKLDGEYALLKDLTMKEQSGKEEFVLAIDLVLENGLVTWARGNYFNSLKEANDSYLEKADLLPEPIYFNNRNGKTYEILKREGEYALLRDVDKNEIEPYVLAILLETDKNNEGHWSLGYYYSSYESALEIYKDKVKKA